MDLLTELQDRELFTLVGTRRFGPELWQPTVEQYLACRHSQRSFARSAMGETAVRAFDAELRQVLTVLRSSGGVRGTSDRPRLGVETTVAWGRPPERRTTAGKTTLGSALARRFNYKEVDVDMTKVRLHGVRFEENALDREAWNRIYDETDREIA